MRLPRLFIFLPFTFMGMGVGLFLLWNEVAETVPKRIDTLHPRGYGALIEAQVDRSKPFLTTPATRRGINACVLP